MPGVGRFWRVRVVGLVNSCSGPVAESGFGALAASWGRLSLRRAASLVTWGIPARVSIRTFRWGPIPVLGFHPGGGLRPFKVLARTSFLGVIVRGFAFGAICAFSGTVFETMRAEFEII